MEAMKNLGLRGGRLTFHGDVTREEILKKIKELAKKLKLIREKWIADLEKLNTKYASDPAINKIRWELGRAYLQAGRGKKAREIFNLLGPSGFTLDERMTIIRTLLNFDMEKKAGTMLAGLDISRIREPRPRLLASALAAATGHEKAALEGLKDDLEDIEDGEEMWDVVDDLERRVLLFPAELYRPLLALLYKNALKRFPGSDPQGKRRALLKGLALKVGSTPPPISVTDMEGKKWDWKAFSGKAVLVYVWATWKPSSLKPLDSLVKIYKKYHPKGFEILGVSLDKPASEAEAYVKKRKLPWIHACDGKGWLGSLVKTFAVKEIPFSILIGPDGRVAGLGLYGKDLEARLQDILPEK